MFPTRFFPRSYFAPRYFPRPGSAVPVVLTGGWYTPQWYIKPEGIDDDEFILLLTGVLLSE